jgi:hypothetical protein
VCITKNLVRDLPPAKGDNYNTIPMAINPFKKIMCAEYDCHQSGMINFPRSYGCRSIIAIAIEPSKSKLHKSFPLPSANQSVTTSIAITIHVHATHNKGVTDCSASLCNRFVLEFVISFIT